MRLILVQPEPNPTNRPHLPALCTNPPPPRSAFGRIEGESYVDATGVVNNGTNVGSLDTGDWVHYSNIDFGAGASSVQLQLAVPVPNSGGKIELHVDSLAGPLIATHIVQTTGAYDIYFPQQLNITPVAGVHDVYLRVTGGSGIGNLDYLQFSPIHLTQIMPLGDSITSGAAGLASYRYFLWNQLQAAGYHTDFVGSLTKAWNLTHEPSTYAFDQNHEGHTGADSAFVAANIGSWASVNVPDIVLMELGENEVRTFGPLATTLTNFALIIDNLRRSTRT